MSTTMYFALFTNAYNNNSWRAIHVYVMIKWCCMPLLLKIQKMNFDGATTNKLTKVVMFVLSVRDGVTNAKIS